MSKQEQFYKQFRLLPDMEQKQLVFGRVTSAGFKGAISPDGKHFYFWRDEFNMTILQSVFYRKNICEFLQAPQLLGQFGEPVDMKKTYSEQWLLEDGSVAGTSFRDWIRLTEPAATYLTSQIGAMKIFSKDSAWHEKETKFREHIAELQKQVDAMKLVYSAKGLELAEQFKAGKVGIKEVLLFSTSASEQMLIAIENFCKEKEIDPETIIPNLDVEVTQ